VESASLIYKALEVEKELRENLVTREVVLSGSDIVATFRGVDEGGIQGSARAFTTSFEFAQEILKELG
jgi:hypothetical protein